MLRVQVSAEANSAACKGFKVCIEDLSSTPGDESIHRSLSQRLINLGYKSSSSLELSLASASLTDDTFNLFHQNILELSANFKFHHIDLSNNRLTDVSSSRICNLITTHKPLYMSVTSNFITQLGASLILQTIWDIQQMNGEICRISMDSNIIDITKMRDQLGKNPCTVCFCPSDTSNLCSASGPIDSQVLHLPGFLRQRFSHCKRRKSLDIIDSVRPEYQALRANPTSSSKSVETLLGIMRSVECAFPSEISLSKVGLLPTRSENRPTSAVQLAQHLIRVVETRSLVTDNSSHQHAITHLPQYFESSIRLYLVGSPPSATMCCGLDLWSVHEGLKIIRKHSTFEQPDLLVGDIIVDIGGANLAGVPADQCRQLLSTHLVDGTVIRVCRYPNHGSLSEYRKLVERRFSLEGLMSVSGLTWEQVSRRFCHLQEELEQLTQIHQVNGRVIAEDSDTLLHLEGAVDDVDLVIDRVYSLLQTLNSIYLMATVPRARVQAA